MRPSQILPKWYRLQQSEQLDEKAEVEKAQQLSSDPIEFFEQVVGFKPFQYQVEFIRMFQNNQFTAARWCRQCVDGDALVFLADGTVEPIKMLSNSWFSGKKPVFRVVSSSGKELIATEDHRFFTKQGWKRLKDISPGDEVFVQNQVSLFGNLEISDETAKILAYLITDGCFRSKGQSIKFTGKEPYVSEFSSAIKNEFPDIEPKLYKKGNCVDVLCTASRCGRTKVLERDSETNRIVRSQVVKNSLRTYLMSLDFIGDIPKIAFEFNRETLSLFINRLYAADGWVSIHKTAKNRFGVGKAIEVAIGFPDKQTVIALQMLLLKFGIHARISEEHPSTRSKKKIQILHSFCRLRIYDIYSMKRFFDAIGLIFGKENQSREASTIISTRIKAIGEGKCPKVTRLKK